MPELDLYLCTDHPAGPAEGLVTQRGMELEIAMIRGARKAQVRRRKAGGWEGMPQVCRRTENILHCLFVEGLHLPCWEGPCFFVLLTKLIHKLSDFLSLLTSITVNLD